MNFQQRQQRFKEALAATAPPEAVAKYSDAFGFSNSAKIVEGGLFAFNVNLDKLGDEVTLLVVHCVLRFPPEEEIIFSLFIGRGLPELRLRLQEMREAGTSKPRNGREAEEAVEASDDGLFSDAGPAANLSGPPTYTDNNKNVKGYIASDGRLYVRNKGFWDALPEDLTSIPRPVPIDRVTFAIWPPAVSARKSLFAREFIGNLGNLIGHASIHELLPWEQTGSLGARMRRMPAAVGIAEIELAVRALGGHYPGGEVRRLHAALNFSDRKHFVILSGLSGTGKTQLAQQYARAVHGIASNDAEDPLLRVCPVRPDWTDPAGLTGYPDVLTSKYLVPTFLEALLLAVANRDAPVFVILDEMNLARIEYYFSDILSCIETRGEVLRLHTNSVPMEGSNGIVVPASLSLPSNLFIIGTINVDETTQSVSDKVLDRAQVIDMSSVELDGFLRDLGGREPGLARAIGACGAQLLAVHGLLGQHGLAFGYRAAEEGMRYAAFAAGNLDQSWDSLIDDLMVQKILVKLRGTERQKPLLTQLRTTLEGKNKAQALLDRLVADLEDFGSFQASR